MDSGPGRIVRRAVGIELACAEIATRVADELELVVIGDAEVEGLGEGLAFAFVGREGGDGEALDAPVVAGSAPGHLELGFDATQTPRVVAGHQLERALSEPERLVVRCEATVEQMEAGGHGLFVLAQEDVQERELFPGDRLVEALRAPVVAVQLVQTEECFRLHALLRVEVADYDFVLEVVQHAFVWEGAVEEGRRQINQRSLVEAHT